MKQASLFFVLLIGCFSSCTEGLESIKLLDQNVNVFKHILFEDELDSLPIIKPVKNHPLDISFYAFSYLYHGTKAKNDAYLNKGFEYLDYLVDYPKTVINDSTDIYSYPFSFSKMDPGWWSAMGNSAVAISFQLAFEISGKAKFKEASNRALNGVLADVKIGGSSIEVSDSSGVIGNWFLEYANDSSTFVNSKMVLNGYLFALININLINSTSPNPRLYAQYKNSVAATQLLLVVLYMRIVAGQVIC